MALQRTFKLSSGHAMPAIGLGTWKSSRDEVSGIILKALEVGYRHFDCAAVCKYSAALSYLPLVLVPRNWNTNPVQTSLNSDENEAEIGEALAAQKIFPRSELFITSKLWNTNHVPSKVALGCDQTLRDLKLDYLDLYLIHWPLSFKDLGNNNSAKDDKGHPILETSVTLEETWAAMEGLVSAGKAKSIGVSNFTIDHLRRILKVAKIKPAVNQVELHPYLPQHELLAFCQEHDILLTAYSPLGRAERAGNKAIIHDPVVVDLASKYGKSPAQVLISWAAQRGTSVIPKTANLNRLQENFQDFLLQEGDMKRLNDLHLTTSIRYVDPSEWWNVSIF